MAQSAVRWVSVLCTTCLSIMSLRADMSQRHREVRDCTTCHWALRQHKGALRWASVQCTIYLSVMSLTADMLQRHREVRDCTTSHWALTQHKGAVRWVSVLCTTCLSVMSLSADTPQRRSEVRDWRRCIPSTKTCSSSSWIPHSDSSLSVCGSVHSAWHSPPLARRLQYDRSRLWSLVQPWNSCAKNNPVLSSVQSSALPEGIYVLLKAYVRSNPSLRSFLKFPMKSQWVVFNIMCILPHSCTELYTKYPNYVVLVIPINWPEHKTYQRKI